MQKIKHSVLDKMMQSDLSRAELDFILYISHRQTEAGNVIGIYYKDVCEAIDISYQTFYDVLHNLRSKGIITYTKEHYGDWNITILNNSFTQGYEGYVSTGDDIFIDERFQKCKPQEKLLAMEFLKISKNPNNGGKYKISQKKMQEKYCRLFHVTKRVLMRYLRKLKSFFSIGIKDGVYFIHPLNGMAKKQTGKTDKELLQDQVSDMVFRRMRVTGTDQERTDTAKLVGQYADSLKDNLVRLFSDAVEESIKRRNENIRNRYKWNRQLAPKFIHKILQEKLQQNYKGAKC